eukprot:TRINITY_DN13652_c0_g1_i3.p1 TRINITY_DN13652_c0_g1~~TRINITY_DN13652_c0_g1_i3.p1  ORF type:complete len:465 (-),score=116.28 TRINITY_DN13652_c0_g1_i3:103-1437(-)
MPASRSRSPKRDVQEAAKAGNSEQEIVSVAIKQLPTDIRERLEKLFEEGLLKEGDLDLRCITVFASLNEGLQSRVMNHMETERIYVANARSKSGFLIATCDKAKTGCLDARGLGAIDPWRTALVAMATPKQKILSLKNEQDWLDDKGESPIKINVNVSEVENEIGMPSVTLELPLTETCAAVKAKLVAMGVRSIPANRMKLHTEPVGFLKERFTFAFYNLEAGVTLVLSQRKRGGAKYRKDHTVMPRRPRGPAPETKPAAATPAAASAPAAAAASTAPAGLPAGLTNMPKMPAMPGLPGAAATAATAAGLGKAPAGMPGMPGMPGTMPGTMPAGMPGLAGGMPGMPGLPNLPSLPKLPGMPGMPGGLPSLPSLPGLSVPGGGMAKSAGAPTPGGGYPGTMPGMPGGMPGMPGGMPGMGGAMPGGATAKGGGMPMPGLAAMPKMG